MSRIGLQPITIPAGVEVRLEEDKVTVKGPKGELCSPIYPGISIDQEGNVLKLNCADMGNKRLKSLFGLCRALIANNVTGVSKGFEKVLELRGVGYRAQAQGRKLVLSLGFSHPVEYELPEGVDAKVEQTKITLTSCDKQRVGQVAAEIRAFRPPEPYKGKGVRYAGEYVAMKEGKKA
ncbi:MAG: 50S ribosomal protein L6 [Zetaproteobacteria bacterium]|nr:MAG: 50S ribosomal protein L6 [Zetaproteobacteria bacterium]